MGFLIAGDLSAAAGHGNRRRRRRPSGTADRDQAAVARLVSVNPKRDMFLGHSLGGLTVLRALLRTPGDPPS